MSSLNIRPAFSFRFKEMIKSMGIFFFVMVALVALIFLTTRNSGGETTFSAFGMASSVFMFIIGICTTREQLRLCIQMGAGRLTSFVSELLCACAITLCLCGSGELLMAATQAVTAGDPHVTITDIYQLFFVGLEKETLTFSQHMLSLLTNASFGICAYVGGAFISLVFFRLNKTMKIVVAVGVPLLFILGFPLGIDFLGVSDVFSASVTAVMNWMGESVGNWAISFLGTAVVFAVINWLIMRKSPITEARG